MSFDEDFDKFCLEVDDCAFCQFEDDSLCIEHEECYCRKFSHLQEPLLD